MRGGGPSPVVEPRNLASSARHLPTTPEDSWEAMIELEDSDRAMHDRPKADAKPRAKMWTGEFRNVRCIRDATGAPFI
jgi:hypothetical protein